MPMPMSGPWPPKECSDPYANYVIWDAWYSSDPDRITDVYRGTYGEAGRASQTAERSFETRPSQHAGGVVGAIAKFWWGRPPEKSEIPVKIHVPIAADIAATSSDLLFAETPKIYIPTPATEKAGSDLMSATNERLEHIFDQNGMDSLLLEMGEVMSALSGAYLRLTYAKQIDTVPLISVVGPDAAVPKFWAGRLREVTFWTAIHTDNKKVIRHLEHHSPGWITNAVFIGEDDTLGEQGNLADYEATRELEESISTGATGLTAEYIPNVRPNRLKRTSSLGRSDLSGIETIMDALDETFSAWLRDIHLGKGRITIPRSLVQGLGEGKGSYWDYDRAVYSPIETLTSPNHPPTITVSQFAIRAEEFARTCREFKEECVNGAGFSPRTFGLASEIATTATENRFLERKTISSSSRKKRYVTTSLRRFTKTTLEVDKHWFQTKGVNPEPPAIEFPKPMQEDPRQLAETADLLNRAEAASVQTLVGMVHPDWDETAKTEEVVRIMKEKGMAVDEPASGFQAPEPDDVDEEDDDPALVE